METFKTIMIDPPWNERGGGKIKRGADKHYPLMKTPDIIRTILQCEHWNKLEDDAHMYLWVTNNFLAEGLKVMESLGFRYVTNIAWVKDRIGLGQYARGKHELLLFGTRGKTHTRVKKDNNKLESVINAKRQRHSQKPEESFTWIESRSYGPYLELFSRKEREGWTAWGNEIANKNQTIKEGK
jgi:N6-adenosine-specific RNA methylase IME4